MLTNVEQTFQAEIDDGILRKDETRINLAPDDKILCSRGKEALYAIQERETYGWLKNLTIPVTHCQTPLCCTAGRDEILRDILVIIPQVRALALWPDRWDDKLCKVCEAMGRERHGAGRNTVWEKLPHIFDFTKWPNLRLAEKQEVSGSHVASLALSLRSLSSQLETRTAPSYLYKAAAVSILHLSLTSACNHPSHRHKAISGIKHSYIR